MSKYEPKWTSVFLGVGFFGLSTAVLVFLAIAKDGGVPMYSFGGRVFLWILAALSLSFVFAAAFMAFLLLKDKHGAEAYEGPGKQAAPRYLSGRHHLWGDYEKAVAAFTDVIAAGYAIGYKYRAVAYEALGKQQEADADVARFATLTNVADNRPPVTGPKPDRSDQTPNFSRSEENEAIDLSWGEGFLSDGRPYRVEHWAESQVTMLTFFFSTAMSDDPPVEIMLTTNAGGNDMWSVNVVIGTEDEIHARDLAPLRRLKRTTT